ncbi:MAG: peroxiredoxin, partial [Pseudomonadota bacterium]|nr:peroxiredoxin [Pseudomonadota bacterium]
MPEVNDIAPDFTLPRDGGGEVSLASLRGAPVVLFFYPKDDTPGCTKESIGFSADIGAFQDVGAQVFGISKDSVAKHDKFVAKHDLKTGMLSDENGTTCEDYGVWKEKKMYGKT